MENGGEAFDSIADAASRLEALSRRAKGGEEVERDEFDSAIGDATAGIIRQYGPRPRAKRGEGAKWKILDYLRKHVNQWVWGEEIKAVANIGEWARRVRELRDEHGWPIEEDSHRYRLTAAQPDEKVAAHWQRMNSIRKLPVSMKDRVRALFEARVGEVITRDDLDYVAGDGKEATRRARELRDEEGWPIESHIDAKDLKSAEYRLVSKDPKDRADPRQRLYPDKLRHKIFQRDNFTCQDCGRDKAAAEKAGDRRFYLEVHHKKAVAEQLDALSPDELNDPDNLITLCHDDHARRTGEFQRGRRKQRQA